jgi:hypothetical protein
MNMWVWVSVCGENHIDNAKPLKGLCGSLPHAANIDNRPIPETLATIPVIAALAPGTIVQATDLTAGIAP